MVAVGCEVSTFHAHVSMLQSLRCIADVRIGRAEASPFPGALEHLLKIHNRGLAGVFGADKGSRVLRLLQRFTDDQRDWLSLVPDSVVLERDYGLPAGRGVNPLQLGHGLMSQDPENA